MVSALVARMRSLWPHPRRRAAPRQEEPGGVRAALAGLQRLVLRSPLYRISLGQRSEPLVATPVDPWTGDAQRGLQILQGTFVASGQSFPIDARVWSPVGAHDGWRADLHGFQWLRDLVATGHEEGRARGRELLAGWLGSQGQWDQLTWRADVLGQRIAAWVQHYEYLNAGLPSDIQANFLDQIAQQTRHLARVVGRGPPGGLRIAALKGLVLGGVALNHSERQQQRVHQLLVAELKRQVHPDGGQIERSPAVQLAVLRDVIAIRDGLHQARVAVPAEVMVAIDRMAPWLRYLRHGDGGLGLFNDTNEDDAAVVDQVLTRADGTSALPAAAPHSGFHRIAVGKTIVLADAGSPGELDGHAHAGTLSFEVSIGRERLIVNCGAHAGDRSEWRRVQRATAAHSTVAIDDTNSSEILGPCSVLPGTIAERPGHVTAIPQDSDGNHWLELSHDGYLDRFGLVHHRRLFVAAGGDDIRGEDTLSPPPGGGRSVSGQRFTARFHLHPRTNAMVVQDGSAVLIRLSSGMPWRFRASGGVVALADSIYLGKRGEMKRSQQIVLSGPITAEGMQVKWALRREGKS